MTKGYEATVGFSSESCSRFFAAPQALCITQEFGTMPGIAVALALIHENAAFAQCVICRPDLQLRPIDGCGGQ